LAEVTVTELFCGPVTLPSTFTEKVQLAPDERAAPARLTAAVLGVAVMVPPPHVPVSPFGDPTINPEGKLSVKAMPVRFPAAFGFVIVKVRLVLSYSVMETAPKLLLMDGGASTVSGADAVLPMPPLLELTLPVVFV